MLVSHEVYDFGVTAFSLLDGNLVFTLPWFLRLVCLLIVLPKAL